MAGETQKITVVVMERTSSLPPVSPWPLIYTLDVVDPKDHAEVMAAVADERMNDLGLNDGYLDDVLDGLELMFCFAGDVKTLVDWRE